MAGAGSSPATSAMTALSADRITWIVSCLPAWEASGSGNLPAVHAIRDLLAERETLQRLLGESREALVTISDGRVWCDDLAAKILTALSEPPA